MASSEILKQGFLVKKGHVRHNWRTRWFALERSKLSYFRKRGDATAAGVIPLVGATLECPPPESTKKQWVIQLKTHDAKEFLIHTPDEATRTEWSDAIEECIRRLDPTKIGTYETLSRSISLASCNTLETQREMVKAMQDPEAGVKLSEVGNRRGKGVTKYFTGKDVVDWLISWSFAEERDAATHIATNLLRNGFFHTVHLDPATNAYTICTDGVLNKHIVDNEDAKYIFVSFVCAGSNELFDSDDDDLSSNSDDETSPPRIHLSRLPSTEIEGVLIKQGFLLKKSKVRKKWKPRRFVLKESSEHLYFYRGSKGNTLRGSIPLRGLTVCELDDKTDQGGQARATKTTRNKINRMLLITSVGERITLEASTAEDRNSWVGAIRVAALSLEINNSTHV